MDVVCWARVRYILDVVNYALIDESVSLDEVEAAISEVADGETTRIVMEFVKRESARSGDVGEVLVKLQRLLLRIYNCDEVASEW